MNDVMQVYLAAIGQVQPKADDGVLSLLLDADIVVQLVLLALIGMSVACWVIIFNKYSVTQKAMRQSTAFLDFFWRSKRLDQVYEQADRYQPSPLAEVFKAAYIELAKLTTQHESNPSTAMDEGDLDNLTRALRRAATVERTNLERMTTFLATTGSTAPFIGLFGTVWGILRAFQKIGLTGQATIQTVGPDIAHALIATAVGLFAAIPAVMAYNYFNSRIRVLTSEMENFSSDFLNIVKRHFRAKG